MKRASAIIDTKVGRKPFIEIPDQVYDSLELKEGESIQVEIMSPKKQLSKEDKLKLLEKMRKIGGDDEKIAEAFAYLDKKQEERNREY